MKNERNSRYLALPPFDSKVSGMFYTVTILSLILVAVIGGLVIDIEADGKDLTGEDWFKLISFSLSGVALLFTVILGTKLSHVSLKSGISCSKLKPIHGLLAILILLGMLFGLGEVNILFIELLKKVGYQPSEISMPQLTVYGFVIITVTICILPAVLEEIIFRGFILRGLMEYGELKAILISALLFAFFHLSPDKTIYQFLVGILFALIAVKTEGIALPILIHFANNFYLIINYYFIDFVPVGGLRAVLIVLGLVSLACGLFLLLYKNPLKKGHKVDYRDFLAYGAGGILGALAIWITSFA